MRSGAPEELRLQKYFTDCGILSRRAAEAAIEKGEVRVNGLPATVGQKIRPGVDRVEYRGREIRPAAQRSFTYVLLNKPRGVLTTMSDDRGRRTVAELVSDVPCRVYPAGRLDYDSDGLLLLTDDGDLVYRMTHPRHELTKQYHVTVRGHATPEQLERLRAPMTLDGYTIRPVAVTRLPARPETPNDTLCFPLQEGRNRQIRKMCQQVGLSITRLCRVAIGPIGLEGLESGRWRYLTADEVDKLQRLCAAVPKKTKN
jgi:23S rRNA pseudouridine2605 synthase